MVCQPGESKPAPRLPSISLFFFRLYRILRIPVCTANPTLYLSRWLGKAGFCAGLGAVILGLHSGWGLRFLGGEQGVWALTAGVVGVFAGVVAAREEGHAPKKKA